MSVKCCYCGYYSRPDEEMVTGTGEEGFGFFPGQTYSFHKLCWEKRETVNPFKRLVLKELSK